MLMSPEIARQMNQWIDVIHNPRYWIIFWLIALYVLFEERVVGSEKFAQRISGARGWLYSRLGVLIFTWSIVASQGFLGGCAVQLVQNYLAREYLSMEYRYPFGLVFREFLDPAYWRWLRAGYLLATIVYAIWIYSYWKRVNQIRKSPDAS